MLTLLPSAARAVDVDARLKYFASLDLLPEEDLQRQTSGTPAFGDNADLRLMFRQDVGPVRLVADLGTTLLRGDFLSTLGPGVTLDQTVVDDSGRLMDLTWELDDGPNHALVQRFDRLALQYREGRWGITLGRQAVSWGNGLVFQPLDLFNPFAPTTVDQDYKAGDDILLVERSLARGGNAQFLTVARRDEGGDVSADAGSVAGKWHRFVGAAELELVAARHYEDHVLGTALRFPVGGALVRSDVVATRLDSGTWKVSGLVNVDYSLTAAQRNLYVFAEYFHSAFGVSELPDSPAEYPRHLVERLERGELFNLMRNYLAVGGTLEWHALWSQSLTMIGNLDDGSVLLQTQISHEPDDHQRLELGLVQPLGRAGDEFGGIPVVGESATLGGGTRLYLRWAYYF